VLKFSGIVRKKGKTKSEGMSEEKGENLSFSERNLRNSDFTRQDDEFEVSQSMEDGRVARLSAKLMRVAQEKESIRQEKEGYRRALEELYGKERQYVLTQKLQADASRRLNVSNQESLKLRHELESERALRMGLERDLLLIREDTSELHESEKELKAERFRNQGELIQMREKVWELDQEKRRISHLNRFIAKHSALAPHTSLGPTPVQPPQGVAPVDHSAWEASSSTDNRSLYSVPHSQLEAKTNPQPVLKSRNSYTSTPSSTTTGTSPTVSFAANFDTTNNSFRTVNSSRTTGRLNHEAKGGMTPSHGVKSRATPNPRDGLFLSEPEVIYVSISQSTSYIL
jgi:myosin heavy subunit